jgi:anti-sigma factor RsiW
MSERITSVSEEELNGYVDGQLSPERRAAVERYLAANPDAARRIATDTFHKQALHAAFAGYSTQPLPPDLVLSRLLEERLQRQSHWWWQIAAAIVLSLGVGGVGGWLLHTPSTPDRNTLAMTALEDQALASHAVYSPDRRHPIEVTAAERDHLAQWLTNRLNRTIAPPDLADFGYRLIGGRLLATEQGSPAALFMYEDTTGHRMSLVMRPMATDLRVPIAQWDRKDVNASSWIDKGLGYAILGQVPNSELDRMARQISGKQG